MAEGKRIKLRAGGKRAPDTMSTGDYNALCVSGEIRQRGKACQAILSFQLHGGAQAENGVVLQKWFNIALRPDGSVSPASVYFQACQLALGRPVQPDEGLDPSDVFVGKSFKVTVGFRGTSLDGSYSQSNTNHRKDPRDFLRIHTLVEPINQPLKQSLNHMSSMTPYELINNVGGGGGGGKTPALTLTPTPPPTESDSLCRADTGNGEKDVRHTHASDGRDVGTGEAAAVWGRLGHKVGPEHIDQHLASLGRWKRPGS